MNNSKILIAKKIWILFLRKLKGILRQLAVLVILERSPLSHFLFLGTNIAQGLPDILTKES